MLQVIGAGFGRTGTLSLKAALETLGFAPCHHMESVIEEPAQAPLWLEADSDPNFDWQRLLARYAAAVDWPTCRFWRSLAAFYPAAKIVLTVRSAESWYKSVANTLMLPLSAPPEADIALPHDMLHMAQSLVNVRTFDRRMHDAAHCMAIYEAHNRAVVAGIPAERLLVYRVEEGWEPLCHFLAVPVPATPFPRANSTEEWRRKVLG